MWTDILCWPLAVVIKIQTKLPNFPPVPHSAISAVGKWTVGKWIY